MAKNARYHRLVDERDLPSWLRSEIELWRRANPSLGTKKGAFGECHRTSHGFISRVWGGVKALSSRGANGLPHISISTDMFDVCEVTEDPYYAKLLGNGPNQCDQHHVARVGFWMIDWTARQFRPRDRFPRIWLWQTY